MIKCSSCGGVNPDTSSNCEYCLSILRDQSAQVAQPQTAESPTISGVESDAHQVKAPDIAPSPVATGNEPPSPPAHHGLSDYYVKAFSEFDTLAKTSPGKLQAKFNWAAFLFGPFWYLYRGLWVKALIYFGVAFGTAGLFALIPWIYATAFGTYDFYLLRKHNKQLW